MSFLDMVNQVIDLSQQINHYYDDEMPKFHSDYPLIQINEVGPPPPPSEMALKKLVMSLPDHSIYQLMMIMYLGRGDFSVDDRDERVIQLQKTFPARKQAITQIISKGPLAKYLIAGLATLTRYGIDPEPLSPEPMILNN